MNWLNFFRSFQHFVWQCYCKRIITLVKLALSLQFNIRKLTWWTFKQYKKFLCLRKEVSVGMYMVVKLFHGFQETKALASSTFWLRLSILGYLMLCHGFWSWSDLIYITCAGRKENSKTRESTKECMFQLNQGLLEIHTAHIYISLAQIITWPHLATRGGLGRNPVFNLGTLPP